MAYFVPFPLLRLISKVRRVCGHHFLNLGESKNAKHRINTRIGSSSFGQSKFILHFSCSVLSIMLLY